MLSLPCSTVDFIFVRTFYSFAKVMHTLICWYATVFNSYCHLILDTGRKKDDTSVNYFNHFRKDFRRPYGLAHDAQVTTMLQYQEDSPPTIVSFFLDHK